MKSKLIIILIILIIIFVSCFGYIRHNIDFKPILNVDNCISVKGMTNVSEDIEIINEIANCINLAKKKRMIFPRQTLHSPTMILSFYMKDGTHESICFYGEYVLYKPKYDGIQYRFDDVYPIYEIASKYHLDE